MKNLQLVFGRWSCVGWLLGLAAGCGGSTLTGGEEGGLTSNPSGAPISEQQLPNQFVDAFCGNIGPCCQAAAIAFDLTTCKQNLSATIGAALVQEMAPKISYDASAAGRCIAAYASEIKACR